MSSTLSVKLIIEFSLNYPFEIFATTLIKSQYTVDSSCIKTFLTFTLYRSLTPGSWETLGRIIKISCG